MLRDLLGPALVAYLGDVGETRAVHQWAAGDRTPAAETQRRLRTALQVALMVADADGPEIAASWLQGLNPHSTTARPLGCCARATSTTSVPRCSAPRARSSSADELRHRGRPGPTTRSSGWPRARPVGVARLVAGRRGRHLRQPLRRPRRRVPGRLREQRQDRALVEVLSRFRADPTVAAGIAAVARSPVTAAGRRRHRDAPLGRGRRVGTARFRARMRGSEPSARSPTCAASSPRPSSASGSTSSTPQPSGCTRRAR